MVKPPRCAPVQGQLGIPRRFRLPDTRLWNSQSVPYTTPAGPAAASSTPRSGWREARPDFTDSLVCRLKEKPRRADLRGFGN
jgi:hypothetical protein